MDQDQERERERERERESQLSLHVLNNNCICMKTVLLQSSVQNVNI